MIGVCSYYAFVYTSLTIMWSSAKKNACVFSVWVGWVRWVGVGWVGVGGWAAKHMYIHITPVCTIRCFSPGYVGWWWGGVPK